MFLRLIFGFIFHINVLGCYFDDFTLLRLVVGRKRLRFLIKNNAKRFEFRFRMTTNRNTIEIFIKDYSKSLIESKSIVLVLDKSQFGLIFRGTLIFGGWPSKFMRNVLDEGLILDEVVTGPIALSKKCIDVFRREHFGF